MTQSQSVPFLVSVIITCYNQAHFLGEAIESVLAQTYPHIEIVVVDDGSMDNPREVVDRYSGISFIRQENQGVAVARNVGLRVIKGDYVVFLDGDDRLLPSALKTSVECLNAQPECAFVSGGFQLIAPDGSPLPTRPQRCVERDHYLQLLSEAYIWTPGAVMFRRAVFKSIGGFNTSLSFSGCDDHELYLRIARNFPVCCHDQVVIEWRQHAANTSSNPVRMLTSVLAVYRSHRNHVSGNKQYQRAYENGIRLLQAHYGKKIVCAAWAHMRAGETEQMKRCLLVFWKDCLPGALWHGFQRLSGLLFR